MFKALAIKDLQEPAKDKYMYINGVWGYFMIELIHLLYFDIN